MARRSRESEIRAALEHAGYELIQFDVESAGPIAADVVAWAANESGELVPWGVVEVKEWSHSQKTRPELGLSPLARARSALGTRDHYVLANGEWFKADAGLRKLERVAGPTPPAYGAKGQVEDTERAVALYADWIRRKVARAQRQPGAVPDFFWPQSVPGLDVELTAASGEVMPASPEVLWEARRRALVEHAQLSAKRVGHSASEHVSQTVVAKAIAALAASRFTSDVFDPFCGTGSFLWEAIAVTRNRKQRLQSVLGWDIDRQAVSLARNIAVAAPIPAEIRHLDAFHAHQNHPGSVPLSTVVLSAPPIGMRLNEYYELSNGGPTKDAEVAAIDLAVSALGEGGRAVLHVGRGFTHRTTAERFRTYLSSYFRVAAVIGLPAGSALGTQVGTVILVIDNARPSSSFVAQLGSDWQTQLAPGGAALEAALAHIDGETASKSAR